MTAGWTWWQGGEIWRNEEGRRFTRLAKGFGSVVAADFDNDGWVDLFSWSHLRLYRNRGGRAFEEVPLPELPPMHSRGAAWADFTGNGFVDLYVGGYENWNEGITYPDLLLANRGDGSFELAWTDNRFRARGVTACDFNRNGAPDVYVSNYRLQPNLLWLNQGGGRFADAAARFNALGASPGFRGGHSIGAAWADVNNNGHLDLVTAGQLFLNRGSGNRWIKVRLTGDGKQVNRSAIGAQVRIQLGQDILTRQVEAGTGEGNQNDFTLHFGLGRHAGPVTLEIFWPDARTQIVQRAETDRLHTIQSGGPEK